MEAIEIIIDALEKKLRSATSIDELIMMFESVTSNKQTLKEFIIEHLNLFAADKQFEIHQKSELIAEIESTIKELEG